MIGERNDLFVVWKICLADYQNIHIVINNHVCGETREILWRNFIGKSTVLYNPGIFL